MTTGTKSIIEYYKTALAKRNAETYSIDNCSAYQSCQDKVDYWYKKVCELVNSGTVTTDDVKKILHQITA